MHGRQNCDQSVEVICEVKKWNCPVLAVRVAVSGVVGADVQRQGGPE